MFVSALCFARAFGKQARPPLQLQDIRRTPHAARRTPHALF
jgi:hypothetical protein